MLENATFLSKPTHARKRAQLGMTLIETMLVLMIGVLVIAGVVVLAQSVLANMKVNRSKQILTQIASGIHTSFAAASSNNTPYADLNLTKGGLGHFSFVPRDLVDRDGKVYLPVGNGRTAEVTVAEGKGGAFFTLHVMPSAGACSDLVLTDFGANSLYDFVGEKAAKGGSNERVGAVGSTEGLNSTLAPNARGSALGAAAVGRCVTGSETIIWFHV